VPAEMRAKRATFFTGCREEGIFAAAIGRHRSGRFRVDGSAEGSPRAPLVHPRVREATGVRAGFRTTV